MGASVGSNALISGVTILRWMSRIDEIVVVDRDLEKDFRDERNREEHREDKEATRVSFRRCLSHLHPVLIHMHRNKVHTAWAGYNTAHAHTLTRHEEAQIAID